MQNAKRRVCFWAGWLLCVLTLAQAAAYLLILWWFCRFRWAIRPCLTVCRRGIPTPPFPAVSRHVWHRFTPRVTSLHATRGNGSCDVWQWLTRRVAVNDATLNHFYCHAWHFRLRPDCTFFLLLIRYFSHFFLFVSYYCSIFALFYNKKHSLTTNKKTL